MDKKKKKIPALRFPGFVGELTEKKNGGKWSENDFLSLLDGPVFNGIYKKKEFHGSGSKIVNMGELFAYPRIGNVEMNRVKLSKKEKERFLLQPGDLIFARRSLTGSGAGKCSIIKSISEDTTFESSIIRARPNLEIAYPDYLYYYFDSPFGKYLLGSILRQVAVSGITGNDLMQLRLNIPTLSEQQKIADFLTAVDDKINQLTRKKTLLEQYKKGVMQKIFSQEIRFPEFDDEWEPKTIGKIGDLLGGGTPDTRNKEFWLGAIPWISSSDLCENNVFEINFNKHINETAIAKSATKLIPAKSILIVSRVGVGKVAVNKKALCTSQDFINLVAYEDYHIFLAYLIKTKTKKLLEFNQGTSIKGFVKSDFEQLKLYLPTLPEQQKIADFLTGIDKKIELVNTRLEKTKEWKRGLLQQMFV